MGMSVAGFGWEVLSVKLMLLTYSTLNTADYKVSKVFIIFPNWVQHQKVKIKKRINLEYRSFRLLFFLKINMTETRIFRNIFAPT